MSHMHKDCFSKQSIYRCASVCSSILFKVAREYDVVISRLISVSGHYILNTFYIFTYLCSCVRFPCLVPNDNVAMVLLCYVFSKSMLTLLMVIMSLVLICKRHSQHYYYSPNVIIINNVSLESDKQCEDTVYTA